MLRLKLKTSVNFVHYSAEPVTFCHRNYTKVIKLRAEKCTSVRSSRVVVIVGGYTMIKKSEKWSSARPWVCYRGQVIVGGYTMSKPSER